MKKIKKSLIIILALVIALAGLSACAPIEEKIDTPELKYDTQYPQTKEEYNLAVNKKITIFMNYLRTHVSSGTNIINGNYPIENEIKAAKDTLASMDEIYKQTEHIYPPSSESGRHSNILLQMKEAQNSMEVYIEYLEKTNGTLSDPTLKSDIEATIKIMQSEYTSLSGVFNITN